MITLFNRKELIALFSVQKLYRRKHETAANDLLAAHQLAED